MKLLYVSKSYVPSRRASTVHVMRMCAALSRAGHDVRLIAKQSHERSALDDHAFYGVEPTFAIEKLARPRWRGGGAVFAARTLQTLIAGRPETELVYTREIIAAAAAAALELPVVYELHALPPRPSITEVTRWLVRQPSFRGLVVISQALASDIRAAGLAPPNAPLIIAHDAADASGSPAFGSRRAGRPRVGYVGNLYPGRGIEIVVEIARMLPACDVEIVGGSERDLASWRARPQPPNLSFAGFLPPAELAAKYKTFDVLVMPYQRHGVSTATGASDTSRWCSPMKMFEYMASGVPVVSSDLPVLGEVLRHDHNALIAAADDPASWGSAIERLLGDRALADRLARQAHQDLISNHTWDHRVRVILSELRLS